jgi:hypothetical protein
MLAFVEMYQIMARAITRSCVVFRGNGQISSAVGDRIVILNLEDGTYYGLSEVGARVWHLIEEPVLVETVWRQILEEYDVEADQCLVDLVTLLQEMESKKLVETRRHETLA